MHRITSLDLLVDEDDAVAGLVRSPSGDSASEATTDAQENWRSHAMIV